MYKEEESVVKNYNLFDDNSIDNTIRPESIAEYIGQTVRVVGTLDKHTGDFTVRIMRNGLTVKTLLQATSM